MWIWDLGFGIADKSNNLFAIQYYENLTREIF